MTERAIPVLEFEWQRFFRNACGRPASILLAFLLSLVAGCAFQAEDAETIEFVHAWGSEGSGDGQFLYIETFAFDSQGRLLVTDALRSDVQVFTPDGRFVTKFGGKGSHPGNLVKPEGIVVDERGNIYVGDYLSGHIKKYDANFRHLDTFSSLGSEPGQTMEAEFMTLASNDLIYVAEAGNHRISAFSR
ncbi:MAG: 6-bladed beta-propeller, partial [Gemmatimonadetes bacterium]|nr:6-bladed beta-propeller [Gemmatimonadota bacterium]